MFLMFGDLGLGRGLVWGHATKLMHRALNILIDTPPTNSFIPAPDKKNIPG